MDPSFCKACGQLVEGHPSVTGAMISIDPDPHPEGTLRFAAGMRLQTAAPGTAKRMYRPHLRTCSSPKAATARASFVCDREGCEIETRHLHCYRCGSTDHLANNCEEES